MSNIILFQKIGKNPKIVSSYRPIALLPTIGKVLEKLITQRLVFYLETNNLINNNQFGFREGRSIDAALKNLIEKIHEGKGNKDNILVLSVDIEGAFDNIQHQKVRQPENKNRDAPKDLAADLPFGTWWLLNQDWQVHTSIQAFADDFVLVIKARTKEDLRRSTQESIGKFIAWTDNNNIKVSPDKTNYILFSRWAAGPRIY
ncbi:hypothetical protein AVEN_83122-1 [Araneus ventricosus]|uniref:Reverse transcriptase domain-containing protein n=1 Tax=Araneus ventricosus TaxID=182803 RepID=A0A4Y2AP98_ARAVE|nr:hypothetical protein AVEN_83122-1 [Araneus ventricosus]